MSKVQQRLKSITNPLFISCLLLLLLNDFYLKATFHNALTGKLSDFCGLIVFAWFWVALLPGIKQTIFFSTALLFVWWKSPYAQSFIEFFSQAFYPIDRVVDVTDLWALLVLPLAYFYTKKEQLILRLNPVPLAFLTFFAFAATSIPPHIYTFDQPQYLLFKGLKIDTIGYSSSEYKIFKKDSFLVVGINSLETYERPTLEDEFAKVQFLKDLDRHVFETLIYGCCEEYSLSYQNLRDSFGIKGKTNLKLKIDSLTEDHLRFDGIRLDGLFKRFTEDSILLIEGHYKAGVEDSTWTYYNEKKQVIEKRFFKAGELIKKQQFEGAALTSEVRLNTRQATVQFKIFHLLLLLVPIGGLIALLYKNFKTNDRKHLRKSSVFEKILATLILSFVTLLLARLIASMIPPFRAHDFIVLFAKGLLYYIILVLLYLVVFFGIKLHHWRDKWFYVLLFALSIVLVEEAFFLNFLSSSM